MDRDGAGRHLLRSASAIMALFATVTAASHPLDDYVESQIRAWGVPGLAVAVVSNGEIVFEQGYGVREIDAKSEVTPNTVFALGSVTKSFTATAAAVLVDEGLLSWSDRAADRVPGLMYADPWITAHATLRDLGAHRIGIDLDVLGLAHSWSKEQTVARLRYIQPQGRYGDFFYSNSGFTTLGRAMEVAAGQSWDEIISTRLFEPLRMSRSSTRAEHFARSEAIAHCWLCTPERAGALGRRALLNPNDDVAAPHGLTRDSERSPPGGSRKAEIYPYTDLPAIAPAGALYSTAHDLALWLLFHLGDGRAGDLRILSEKELHRLHSYQIVLTSEEQSQSPGAFDDRFAAHGYGLGWRKEIYRGHEISRHEGGQVGFGAVVWLVPDRKLGVVVLQNMDYRQSSAHRAVVERFIEYYLDLPSLGAERFLADRWSPVYEGRTAPELPAVRLAPSAALDSFIGAYAGEAVGEAVIRKEAAGLIMVLAPDCVADLWSLGGQNFVALFRSADRGRTTVAFSLDPHGVADGFTLGKWGGESQESLFTRKRQEGRDD
jgi:CubicO group peptidase (beta-lactamase class C family)